MRLPIRMNTVDVVLRPLNVGATVIDPDFREQARSKKFDTAITLPGQPNFMGKTIQDRSRTHTGDSEPSYAWIVFRIADLVDLGYEPKKGDRIDSVAGRPMKLEIKQARPESPLNGAFLLLYAVVEEVKEERASL